jgi:phosphoserine aminotransferase
MDATRRLAPGKTRTAHRVYNFAPGPAMLPFPVMERAQAEFLNWNGLGASVAEISHRSREFEALLGETDELLRELMAIPVDHRILYVHGGASLQFSAIPLNLMGRVPSRRAHYFETGNFAARAIEEARRYGTVHVVASSAATNHDRIPEYDPEAIDPDAAYCHITSNNTLYGTRWVRFPETGEVPLVADATSDILSRVLDIRRFGVIYAGAQKNLGISGLALVIVREDLLGHAHPLTPNLLNYTTYARDHSLTNTPNTFAIYMARLVLEWLKARGGIAAIEQVNRRKAETLYDAIDRSPFYRGHAQREHRSITNVTFHLARPELQERFLAEALQEGLYALKGHRAVGGLRASLYNAMPLEGVRALTGFMTEFERRYG